MFGDYVFEKSSAQYADNILLLDDEDLNSRANYISAFSAHGFEIVRYTDDLAFRIEYEEKLKTPGVKLAVLARSSQYIPYDVRRRLNAYMVALESLFPKLHPELLKDKGKADLDLLCAAYKTNFDDFRQKRDTETYLRMKVYSRANVKAYLKRSLDALLEKAGNIKKYSDWFALAEEKAQLDVMAVQYEIDLDTQEINRLFQEYALAHFGKLSQNIDKSSPVLVSKASVSRQCLLSGKYPSQLLEPWKQSKEKTEFVDCARTLGYTDSQIGYERGYDAQFGSFVRCGAVIINDVDDMVHAQTQGRLGMFNDITVLANQKKLLKMTKRFMATGYDVYITADHGNTPCTGLGKLMGTGVEVETKSRRTLALKDFADKAGLIEKHGLVEYPKYYLPKEYDYLICDVGDSFDAKGDEVMTHGGITFDEVVVPFIKIKAVQKNG